MEVSYNGTKLGGKGPRSHQGGFCKGIFLKRTDIYHCQLNTAWGHVSFERIFERDVYKPVSGSMLGKRKKPDKSHLRPFLRASVVRNVTIHYLLLEDHPERRATRGATAASPLAAATNLTANADLARQVAVLQAQLTALTRAGTCIPTSAGAENSSADNDSSFGSGGTRSDITPGMEPVIGAPPKRRKTATAITAAPATATTEAAKAIVSAAGDSQQSHNSSTTTTSVSEVSDITSEDLQPISDSDVVDATSLLNFASSPLKVIYSSWHVFSGSHVFMFSHYIPASHERQRK